MPHASGGGSGGGGFSGGGFYGYHGSNARMRYYPGSKRHLRDYNDGTDAYLNGPRSQKNSILSIIAVSILSVIATFVVSLTVQSRTPLKLNPRYSDAPAVHDDAGIIFSSGSLTETLKKYQETTGICPVVYTVYEEDWKSDYSNLSKYTYDMYVKNFNDEQHLVVVCSIPEAEAGKSSQGFKLEAVQGDLTDPFLTNSWYSNFKSIITKDIGNGADAGLALNNAFTYSVDDAVSKMNPTPSKRLLNLFISFLPVIITAVIFIIVITAMIVKFVKAKKRNEFNAPRSSDPRLA